MRRYIEAIVTLAAVLALAALPAPASAAQWSAPYDESSGAGDRFTGVISAGSVFGVPVTGAVRVLQSVSGTRTATAHFEVAHFGSGGGSSAGVTPCIRFIDSGNMFCGSPPTANADGFVFITDSVSGSRGVEFLLFPRAGSSAGLGSVRVSRIDIS